MSIVAAISKMRNVHREMDRLVEDISIQNNAGYLMDPAKHLWDEFDKNQLKIDVLFIGNSSNYGQFSSIIPGLSEDQFKQFQKEEKLTFELNGVSFRLYTEDHFPVKNAKELATVVKICIVETSQYDDEELAYFIQRFTKETVLLYLTSSDQELIQKTRGMIPSGGPWKARKLPEGEEWTKVLNALTENRGMINLIALTLNTRKLGDAFEATIESELRDLSARKVSVHNDHMKLKKMSSERIGQDLFTNLRTNLQRSFGEFENGINERYSKITRNQPGSLVSFINESVDKIDELEEVKDGGQTKYVLPPEVLKDIENKAKFGVNEHLTNDVISLNDYLQITIEEIDQLFKANGLTGFQYPIKKFEETEVPKFIENNFHYEKEHDAKGTSKGLMQYFSAARGPYMIIVMTGSMLGVFVNAFKDNSPEAKQREQALIDQNIMPTSTKLYIAIVAAALIAGIIIAIRSAKRNKISQEKDETKRIHQWLKSEYKRFFGSIERDWKSRYFKHAKDQFNEIMIVAEQNLKNFQSDRVDKIGSETNLTQRKVQSLEAFDKKLQDAKRRKMQIESDMNSVGMELKQAFNGIEV